MSFLIEATKPDALRNCISTDTTCRSGIRDPITFECVLPFKKAYKLPVEGREADKGYCFDATRKRPEGRSSIGKWVEQNINSSETVTNPASRETFRTEGVEFVKQRERIEAAGPDGDEILQNLFPQLQEVRRMRDNPAAIAMLPHNTGTDERALQELHRLRDGGFDGWNDVDGYVHNETHERWTQPSPLMYALEYGYPTAVRFLLEQGANPNAVVEWGLPVMNKIWDHGHVGDYNEVQAMNIATMLEFHADPNVGGYNHKPLHYAVESEHVEHVRILLDGGADPNGMSSSYSHEVRRSILYWATTAFESNMGEYNIPPQEEMILMLFAAGARPDDDSVALLDNFIIEEADAHREELLINLRATFEDEVTRDR